MDALVPTLGLPNKFLEAGLHLTELTVRDHLETEAMRVIYTTGNTVDAVPLRDEFAGFANDRHDDGYHIPISQWVGVAPRHSISQFTVARQTIVNGVEIQLYTSPPGVLGTNSVWVAIFSSDDAAFAVNRALVSVLGYRHAHQIGDDYWTLIYLVADDVTLNVGTYYWLALCAADPRVAPADEWAGAFVLARRYLEAGAGVTLIDNLGDPYPDAGSAYDAYANRATWFRLYERTYTIEDIPLADGALAPGIGESATVRRIAGVHHDMEVIGPSGGWSGIRTGEASGGGAVLDHNWLGGLQGNGPDYYHLDLVQYGDLTTNMPFTQGSVIFIDVNNDLAEDNAEFFWDAANARLGIGTNVIPHGGVGWAKVAIEGPNADINGPHVQFTTDADDYPLLQMYNNQHDSIALAFDAYFQAGWKSSDPGSNFLIFKFSDELQFYYASGVAAGAAVGFAQGPTLNTSGQWLGVVGNAALPSFSFIADPNTGRWWVGADNMQDVTGGNLAVDYGTVPTIGLLTAADPIRAVYMFKVWDINAGTRIGIQSYVQTAITGATANNAFGAYSRLYFASDAGGAMTGDYYGHYILVSAHAVNVTGTYSYVHGLRIIPLAAMAAGAVVNNYGLRIDTPGVGTNRYHIHLAGVIASGYYFFYSDQFRVHGDHCFLDPTAYNPATNGDFVFSTEFDSAQYYQGDTTKHFSGMIDFLIDIVNVGAFDAGGVETVMQTTTMDKDNWGSADGKQIVLNFSGIVMSRDAAANETTQLRVRVGGLAGTIIWDCPAFMAGAGVGNRGWRGFQGRLRIYCNANPGAAGATFIIENEEILTEQQSGAWAVAAPNPTTPGGIVYNVWPEGVNAATHRKRLQRFSLAQASNANWDLVFTVHFSHAVNNNSDCDLRVWTVSEQAAGGI